jgi:peroxiredoxin
VRIGSQKLRCPGCGSANYPTDAVCLSCGRECGPAPLAAPPAGATPPGAHSQRTASSSHGTTVLLLGALSLILGHFTFYGLLIGPVAWLLGNRALAMSHRREASPSERAQIQVGRICGMISTGFLALLLAVVMPLLGLGFLAGGGGSSAPSVRKNAPAPTVHLTDLAGREQTLDAYRGRVVLVSFFASWCGPCNAEAPHLEADYWQKWRERGVVVIGIDTGESGDPMEHAAHFQAEHQLTYPILVDRDNSAQEAFGVSAFSPTSSSTDEAL